ncbi:MAG: aminotransferase class IV [Deltaproteobacteria bacterium]|nr:aminotransferase class IV [Deltaproteobacteria bacterium]
MPTRVFLDGEVVPAGKARVSVFDRGFLYGDSVYEVLRTFGGAPFALGEHLDRLDHSGAGLRLPLPPRVAIEAAVRVTLAAAGNAESYVRVMVTRGSGPIGLDPALGDRPVLIVIVRELELPDARLYRDGAEVALVSVWRNHPRALDPAIKSGNYLNNILALAEARGRGAYEALLRDAEGFITEGSSSSLFVVTAGTLQTPPLGAGILDGITRRHVIRLARSRGLVAEERPLRPADLTGADEAFICSSLRSVLPVTRVDGVPLGAGRPGPVTLALAAAYLDHARVAAG